MAVSSFAYRFFLTLNIDYNGQSGSNVLGGNTQTSQSGRQGSAENTASRERAESTEQSADSECGIDGDSRGIRSDSEDRASQSEENATEIKPSMSVNEAKRKKPQQDIATFARRKCHLAHSERCDYLFG